MAPGIRMLLSARHNTERGDTDPTDSLSILLTQAGESRQIEIKAGESFARMPASVSLGCFVWSWWVFCFCFWLLLLLFLHRGVYPFAQLHRNWKALPKRSTTVCFFLP